MRFGVTLPNCGVGDDPHAVIDLAVEAEAAGWDGAFLWDFPIGALQQYGDEVMKVHEAWLILAAIAERTRTLTIGTMITPIAWRQPWYVAKQASTMQALSDGRFVLSVGLGSPPPDGNTLFYEETDRRTRARMLDEALSIMRGLWSGEPLEFEGRHFKVRGGPQMLPANECPKVWVVGAWNLDPDAWPKKRSFRRALQWDGLLPHVFNGDRMFDGGTEAIRAMCDDVACERKEPFDVIIEAGSTNDENTKADVVRGYADAGATWWLEPVWYSMYRHPGDPSVMRDRIWRGPPQI
jgi:hypothetical protein